MNTYNKIMLYFWLVSAILIFAIVTVMGIKDGFNLWGYYYFLGAIAAMAYLSRRWMMKRFERNHDEFYQRREQEENNEEK